jgi:APA family basic amino acid/polyamine antiporter
MPVTNSDVKITLERTLRLRDLTLLVIGSVIGSGVFLVPGAILRQVGGSVGLGMIVWLVGGVLSLLGALTYGELTAMKPEAGGLYIYIRDGFGRLPAFLYGWSLFLVISNGAVAALATAFSTYLDQVLPLGPYGMKVVSVGMIALLTVVNVRGTRGSANMQNWTTLAKSLLLLGICAVLLARGRHFGAAMATLWPERMDASTLSSFGLAMIPVLWAYEGWQFPTYSAGEAKNPQRDFPLAFLVGMTFLVGIYLVANLAYLSALGPQGATSSTTIAATSIAAVWSAGASKLVSLAILISVFSAANSIQLTAPRVFYAMAADGLFFRKLAEVHERFRTPAAAITLGGIWGAFLAATGTFEKLTGYVVFAGWIFYGLSAASIFTYRQRESSTARPYRVPGYPWTPLIFVVAAFALVANTIASAPKDAAVGLVIVFSGLPAYVFWRKSGASATSRPV